MPITGETSETVYLLICKGFLTCDCAQLKKESCRYQPSGFLRGMSECG